jgi:capsular polysaccharide biosynthesis protein
LTDTTSRPSVRRQREPELFGRPVPRIGILQAATRHWLLVVIPTVLLIAAAVFVGLRRTPVYTSEARLVITGIDISQPGALSGYTTATQALASSYSRAITADGVVDPVARQIGDRSSTVAGRLAATPVPDSPVVRVAATGSSSGSAVALANAASNSLIDYVAAQNTSSDRARRLLNQYRDSSKQQTSAQLDLDRARNRLLNNRTSQNRSAFADAQATFDGIQARTQALHDAYQVAQQGQTSAGQLQFLNRATSAGSDRRSKLQFYLFAALVAGLAIGLALANLRAQRELRRWLSP